MREVHRIVPPHLAMPRMRRLLDLARVHRPAGLARVARHQFARQAVISTYQYGARSLKGHQQQHPPGNDRAQKVIRRSHAGSEPI